MKPICAARSTAVRTDAPPLVDDTVDVDLRLPKDARTDMHVVYSQYSGPVFRFLKSRVGNWEDAED